MIAKACPFPAETVNDAVDHWRDGDSPRHPIDQGVFAMCDHVAQDLDKADEKAGDQADKMDSDLEDLDDGGDS